MHPRIEDEANQLFASIEKDTSEWHSSTSISRIERNLDRLLKDYPNTEAAGKVEQFRIDYPPKLQVLREQYLKQMEVDKAKPIANREEEAPFKAQEFQIVEVKDFSFGSVKRYDLRVRVDSVLTSGELESVSRSIIEELEVTKPHNALIIFYYLPDSDINGLYTAGKAIWAPYGDWAKADVSLTGSYSKHQLSLSPVSATDTDQEKIKVSEISLKDKKKIFFDLVAAQDRGVGDDEAYGIVAKQYNMDEPIVRKIAIEGVTQGWPMP